jgi:hypothetical protein
MKLGIGRVVVATLLLFVGIAISGCSIGGAAVASPGLFRFNHGNFVEVINTSTRTVLVRPSMYQPIIVRPGQTAQVPLNRWVNQPNYVVILEATPQGQAIPGGNFRQFTYWIYNEPAGPVQPPPIVVSEMINQGPPYLQIGGGGSLFGW